MRFLVDAQLPKSLAELLRRHGYSAVHTLELPDQNLTTDKEICQIADNESMIVITKDSDFIQSHILSGTPKKLLIVYTGNIKNSELLGIFKTALGKIVAAFQNNYFIELHEDKIVIHANR